MAKIGKRIGSRVWVHRSCCKDTNIPPAAVFDATIVMLRQDKDFVPDIIRYDSKEKSVALIQCPEFQTVCEPTVGPSWLIRGERASYIKGGSMVYHHRHLFITEDLAEFDFEESKLRMKKILRLKSLGQLDPYRMGGKTYWREAITRLTGEL